MKLVAEYLERSMEFQRMADEAADPEFKTKLHEQAMAYYRLAVKRAQEMGVKPPDPPPNLH